VQAPHESPVPHIPPHQHLDVVDVVHISRHGVRHAAVVQRQQAAGLEARGEEPPERGERAQGAHGQCGCVGGGEGDFGGPKRVLRQLFREELMWQKSGMKGAVRWGPEMGGDGGTRGANLEDEGMEKLPRHLAQELVARAVVVGVLDARGHERFRVLQPVTTRAHV
jgi:hypothetical protein